MVRPVEVRNPKHTWKSRTEFWQVSTGTAIQKFVKVRGRDDRNENEIVPYLMFRDIKDVKDLYALRYMRPKIQVG